MAALNKGSGKRIVWTVLLVVLYASAFATAAYLNGYRTEYAIGLISTVLALNMLYSLLYFVNEFRYDRMLSGRASLVESAKIQARRKYLTWFWVVLVNVSQLFVFTFLFQYLYTLKGDDYFHYNASTLTYWDWLLYTFDCVFRSFMDIPEIFGWSLRKITPIALGSQTAVAVVRLLIYTLLVAALLRQWRRWLLLRENIAAMNVAPQMAGRRLVRMGDDVLEFLDDAMLKSRIFEPEPNEIDRLQRDEHSEPLLQMLLRNLSVGNTCERENAAILLGLLALEDQSSHPYVMELVEALEAEKSPAVRTEIVRTLGKLAEERAFRAIRGAMTDPEAAVRVQAARALGKVQDERSIQTLTQAINDESVDVRVAAVRALGRIGHRSARNVLYQALQDANSDVSVEAVFSLAHLFEPTIGVQLLHLLESDEPKVRRKAAECIKKVRPEGVEDTLCSLLHDDEAFVRLAATEVLGQLRPDMACENILRNQDTDPVVMRAQVAILREHNEERYLSYFADAVKHSDAFVRERAIGAIGEYHSDAAVATLLEVLKKGDLDDAMHAIRALGMTQNPKAYEPLLELVRLPKTPEHLRRQAGRSLRNLDPARAGQDLGQLKVTNS
ncbi:MAG: hypothetical protein EP343_15195 [Deltaproteobacteria bacterium]|nr:MAG: hypothetical protein EP343_15195 [Deltaproteobacteria bacterium]